MHTEALPRPAVCPACTILPHEQPHAADSAAPGDIVLSLPTIHCAVCISAVERQLARMQGVTSARVNLSLRRVLVTARTGTTAGDLIASLATIGYEAHELDADLLSQAPDDAKGRNLLMRLAVSGFAMIARTPVARPPFT
ncbi:MAG: cation transporter [Paracoccaceae bacterium]